LENHLLIEGELAESDALRFSPAGIPILRFRIRHQSRQREAGSVLETGFELEVMAFDAQARLLATTALGTMLKIRGFLDRKTRSGRAIVMHAREIEFVVGRKDQEI